MFQINERNIENNDNTHGTNDKYNEVGFECSKYYYNYCQRVWRIILSSIFGLSIVLLFISDLVGAFLLAIPIKAYSETKLLTC